jgi:hypothetical protein
MKRRTLDITFAGGGLVLAALLAVLGYVVIAQADFATTYVAEELSTQKITFATADKLTDAEKNWKAGSSCLVTYAGQAMSTGPQAECYAKYYIREHMHASAVNAGFPGATYATLGSTRTELTAQVAALKAKGDTAGAAEVQKKLDAATSLRSTLQSGETLSGLLLTVYGFSVIGAVADTVGNLLFVLAVIVVILSAAGFLHAYVTPKDEVIFGRTGMPATVPSRA